MTREEKIWVIMSKDRKVIAKGTPRNRYLIHLSDTKTDAVSDVYIQKDGRIRIQNQFLLLSGRIRQLRTLSLHER